MGTAAAWGCGWFSKLRSLRITTVATRGLIGVMAGTKALQGRCEVVTQVVFNKIAIGAGFKGRQDSVSVIEPGGRLI